MDYKNIIDKVKNSIPRNVDGVEKIVIIGDEIERLSSQEMLVLKGKFESLLEKMIEKNASDIDIGGWGCGKFAWYRVNDRKNPEENIGEFDIIETDILLQSIFIKKQREVLYKKKNLDFSYQIDINGGYIRFRGDVYFDLNHICLNIRFISSKIRPFNDLGFHPNVSKVLNLTYEKSGLILITGVTGSGKSSTLDSIIDANNKTVDAHIIIIASPVETIHKPNRCIIRHREVGRDVESFKEGTIQALRQDPDIIVVGEMRDSDTIMTVLEVTDSGHKVFSTLHTASAVESIDRIIAECPSQEQERVRTRLADTLQCVISQKLIPGLDKKLVLAKEVMLMIPPIKAAIKNNNISEIYQMINESSDKGMVTLEKELLMLYKQNKISLENAINYANNKKRMNELLGIFN
jgi:twitching motility protein PilT